MTGLELPSAEAAESLQAPPPTDHLAAHILDRSEVDSLLKRHRSDSAEPVFKMVSLCRPRQRRLARRRLAHRRPLDRRFDFDRSFRRNGSLRLHHRVLNPSSPASSAKSRTTNRHHFARTVAPRSHCVFQSNSSLRRTSSPSAGTIAPALTPKSTADLATMLSEAYDQWEFQHP